MVDYVGIKLGLDGFAVEAASGERGRVWRGRRRGARRQPAAADPHDDPGPI